MSDIVLLCNVGTREVQLDAPGVLPADVCDQRGMPLARLAGAHLREPQVFELLKDQLRLPMIEKALHVIAPQHKGQVQIVLFATDQAEHIAQHYRNHDTLNYAEVIREVLAHRYQRDGLIKRHVRIVRIDRNNPADYDSMYDFYQGQLPELRRQLATDAVTYLLIAGGTPQMNTMLLFIGSQVFGRQARPIYVSPDRERALLLDITRQIYAQALRRNLTALLDAYAYAAAADVLDREVGTFTSEQEAMLRDVLGYVERRRNFDLPGAAAALDEAYTRARVLRAPIEALQQDIAQDTEPIKLRETIYLAQIAAETGNWSDFLARLHRFSEGCLQLMAEQLGVQWSKRERASYKERWWDEQRAWLHELGLAAITKPDDSTSEDRRRIVDRRNLRLIVAHLAAARGNDDYTTALTHLEVVDRPVALRNDIVHRFTPISEDEVKRKAATDISQLLTHMRAAYPLIFGTPVSEVHPYRQVNDLCHRILQGER